MDTEQASQAVEPFARTDHEQGGQNLYQELVAVTYSYQVVGHAYQEQHHASYGEE